MITKPCKQEAAQKQRKSLSIKIHLLERQFIVLPTKTTLVLALQTLTLLLFAACSETRAYSGTDDQLADGSTNLTGPTGNAAASQSPATNVQAAAEKIQAAMKLVGKPVPKAFKLPLLTGGEIELPPATNHGPLLLDFCASWCKPSREAMQVLADIAKDYSARGVRYVAVNQGEAPETIRRYLAKTGLDVAVALDKQSANNAREWCLMAKAFRVDAIPTIVIVDRSNIVRYVQLGACPELGEELRRALDEVLKAESGSAQSSPAKSGNSGSAKETK